MWRRGCYLTRGRDRHLLLEHRVPQLEIAANQLVAMGYTNVRKYAEGKQDWVEAGLPLESSLKSVRVER